MSRTDADPSSPTASPSSPIPIEGRDHFEAVVADYDLVLVDFHADWCGPCVALDDVVRELAAETAATVATVDVDAREALAAEFGVRSLPTVVFIAGGEVVEQLVGMQDRSTLDRVVDRYAD